MTVLETALDGMKNIKDDPDEMDEVLIQMFRTFGWYDLVTEYQRIKGMISDEKIMKEGMGAMWRENK